MDVEFWIYIIIGIIFFLSKMLKRAEQPGQPDSPPERPQGRRPRPVESTSPESSRPLTFEELLREITEGKTIAKPEPQPLPSEPLEGVMEEAQSLEEIRDEEEDARAFKAFEEARRQASLAESVEARDKTSDSGRFKAFETRKESRLLNTYIALARNPQTLKQAVVMSEILKRKF